jgi:uncharacterized membrane protein YkvI
MTMGMGSVFAGGGELVANMINVPYVIGAVIISAIVFLLTTFGSKVFLNSAAILSVILVGVLTVVTGIGIIAHWDELVQIISSGQSERSLGSALFAAVLYASFQCIIAGSTVSVSDVLVTRRDVVKASIYGFLLNGGMMLMICVMMLGYYPAVNGEVLPVYYIISDLGIPFLQPAYTLILFLAFITTGITLIFAIVKRFEKFGAKSMPKIQTRRTVYSITFIVVCYFISLVGLLNIVKLGYSAVGYLGIPFVLLPTIIVGHIKMKKEKEKQSNTPEDTTPGDSVKNITA